MRTAEERVVSDALLLRRVSYRDNDVIVQLFTEQRGSLSAIARGARRSGKRFAALEPMHLLHVDVGLDRSRELGTLKEAGLARPRLGLTARLDTMEAAGVALRWVRTAAPGRSPEPDLWRELNALLDALDAPSLGDAEHGAGEQVRFLLAASGARMLAAAGWNMQLRECVRCDTPVPINARVQIDIGAGGVVCTRCGGGAERLSSAARRAFTEAVATGALEFGSVADAEAVIELVDRSFCAHGSGGRR